MSSKEKAQGQVNRQEGDRNNPNIGQDERRDPSNTRQVQGASVSPYFTSDSGRSGPASTGNAQVGYTSRPLTGVSSSPDPVLLPGEPVTLSSTYKATTSRPSTAGSYGMNDELPSPKPSRSPWATSMASVEHDDGEDLEEDDEEAEEDDEEELDMPTAAGTQVRKRRIARGELGLVENEEKRERIENRLDSIAAKRKRKHDKEKAKKRAKKAEKAAGGAAE